MENISAVRFEVNWTLLGWIITFKLQRSGRSTWLTAMFQTIHHEFVSYLVITYFVSADSMLSKLNRKWDTHPLYPAPELSVWFFCICKFLFFSFRLKSARKISYRGNIAFGFQAADMKHEMDSCIKLCIYRSYPFQSK